MKKKRSSEIGVQEMRDKASFIVRMAEAGETFTITRRGKAVARMGPLETIVEGSSEKPLRMGG